MDKIQDCNLYSKFYDISFPNLVELALLVNFLDLQNVHGTIQYRYLFLTDTATAHFLSISMTIFRVKGKNSIRSSISSDNMLRKLVELLSFMLYL